MRNLSLLERRKEWNLFEKFKSMIHPQVYIAENVEDYFVTKINQSLFHKVITLKPNLNEYFVVIPDLIVDDFYYEAGFENISFSDKAEKLSFRVHPHYFPLNYIEENFFDPRRFENYAIIFSKRFIQDGIAQLQGLAFQSEIDSLLSVVENPYPINLRRYLSNPRPLRLMNFKKDVL